MQRSMLRRGGLAILVFLAVGVAGLFGQVANGGFETNGGVGTSIFAGWTVTDQPGGSGSWYVQTGAGSPLNGFPVPPPTQGTFAAMTDQPGPGSHLLYQNITVPATGGTLTFDLFIQNLNGTFVIPSPETLDFSLVANQHARVDIMTTASAVDDVGAGVLKNVYITNPGDPPTSGYTNISVPLAPWAGQTVRLRFAEVDNQIFFNMGIDNVKLTAGTLYGTDGIFGNLLVIDPNTGAGTVVGPTGVFAIPSLAVDPTTHIMYAGGGAGAPFVYTVDKATGAATLVGDSGLGFAAIGAMDFRADGTLFAAVNIVGDGGTGSDHLATIDKTTGVATVIGPFGVEGMEGIAFNSSGTLYGAQTSRGSGGTPGLYTINTATGAATFVALILDSSSQPPSGGISSLQFDCDGTLFGGTATAIPPGGPDGGRLVKINPLTGVFSFVGAVSATGFSSLGALALDKVCAASSVTALSPAHLWIGLRNSDDQGTQFDLKVELLRNGNPVASGLQRCITGVTRNPTLAKEAVVPWDAFVPEAVGSGDVLALRVSTRIGTTPAGAKCPGPGGSHNNARGLRLYYDSTGRPSRFDLTLDPDPSEDLFLHSNGGTCPNGDGDSPGVTARTLDSNPPTAANPRCKDSGTVNFNGGNPFSLIGTWSLAPLP